MKKKLFYLLIVGAIFTLSSCDYLWTIVFNQEEGHKHVFVVINLLFICKAFWDVTSENFLYFKIIIQLNFLLSFLNTRVLRILLHFG